MKDDKKLKKDESIVELVDAKDLEENSETLQSSEEMVCSAEFTAGCMDVED